MNRESNGSIVAMFRKDHEGPTERGRGSVSFLCRCTDPAVFLFCRFVCSCRYYWQTTVYMAMMLFQHSSIHSLSRSFLSLHPQSLGEKLVNFMVEPKRGTKWPSNLPKFESREQAIGVCKDLCKYQFVHRSEKRGKGVLSVSLRIEMISIQRLSLFMMMMLSNVDPRPLLPTVVARFSFSPTHTHPHTHLSTRGILIDSPILFPFRSPLSLLFSSLPFRTIGIGGTGIR